MWQDHVSLVERWAPEVKLPKSLPSRPYPFSIDNSVHMYMCEVDSPGTNDSGLYYEVNCDNAGLHGLLWGQDLLGCDSVCNCLDLRDHEYI